MELISVCIRFHGSILCLLNSPITIPSNSILSDINPPLTTLTLSKSSILKTLVIFFIPDETQNLLLLNTKQPPLILKPINNFSIGIYFSHSLRFIWISFLLNVLFNSIFNSSPDLISFERLLFNNILSISLLKSSSSIFKYVFQFDIVI